MDTLTHGLFGLAVGALRRPDGERYGPTDRAVLLGCVLAAELPDLDYLLPGDPVLRTLRAHRGLSHSLICTPVVAAVATVIVVGLLRWRGHEVRGRPVWLWSWLAVALAHLLPDLWTGWGTRLFLPVSSQRLALDWTMVLDPLVTLPMLVGALVGWRRRPLFRRAVLAGAAVAVLYVGARVVCHEVLLARVAAAYPAARVAVFPVLLKPLSWRFVAEEKDVYVAGRVGLSGAPVEQARHPRTPLGGTDDAALREALAWARFPLVTRGDGELRVADLRYHFAGQPTLTFVFRLDDAGKVIDARLDRGRDLVRRWRED